MPFGRSCRLVALAVSLGTMVSLAPYLPVQSVRAAEAPKTRVNLKDGAEMVLVPEGPYLAASMHHPAPVRKQLAAYYIYRYPVSVAQYRKFCLATGRPAPPATNWDEAKGLVPDRWLKGIDNSPVDRVSWEDAAAYCQWASVELPTDAQWEKAAWGELGPERVPPSPFGVEELRVIVHQWCRYNAEDLATSTELKKTDPAEFHSIRGAYGPFDPNPWEHSSLTRGVQGNGFRCVVPPS